jgi:lipid II:glycine glycyltransferase (peptidoglycan interpeptide bridge formation enzyme)
VNLSLFQEEWWLAAIMGDEARQVTVCRGNEQVGRLSYMAARRFGFRTLQMPTFTHVLGPAIDSGKGKPQTRLMRRLSVTQELIKQLPYFDSFKQVIDPSLDSGLALADGLAFQSQGFLVRPQYTFEIDCRVFEINDLWNGMNFKVRQHIRRAQEKYVVTVVDDPNEFVEFYEDTLRRQGLQNYMVSFDRFSILFKECARRQCGLALSARAPNGTAVAMSYLVWGNGKMYYLLSRRTGNLDDHGSVNLLIWSAIARARELGLVFDFDGVSTQGTARFLSGFGGKIKTRLVVTKAKPLYATLQNIKILLQHVMERHQSCYSNFD